MSSIPVSALMCHAPIVIPQIGKGHASQCESSTRAMRQIAAEIADVAPSRVVIISPHAPRHQDAFGYFVGDRLQGNFAQFGHPELTMDVPLDADAQGFLEESFDWIRPIPFTELDHGTGVPLWFLCEASYEAPTTVISLPYRFDGREWKQVGQLVAEIAKQVGSLAIVASGDMSHRLLPGAPAGFDPRAREFDRYIVEHVRKGDYRTAIAVPSDLRALAAEDVVDSLAIAGYATDFSNLGARVFSYEGPFGVGYLNAILHRELERADR